MKSFLFFVIVALLSPLSFAASSIEGSYSSGGPATINITKTKGNLYDVWIGIGYGSCGGEVHAKGKFPLLAGNKFLIPWTLKEKGKKPKKCTTQVLINGTQANVSDSCLSSEDEENGSTCDVLGDYTKE